MSFMTIVESEAKMQAASILSQSVSLCLERKYLEKIAEEPTSFALKCIPSTSAKPVTWISVNQVGKPLNDAIENSFTTIQKILFSCHLPKEMQLLFLVTGGLHGCKLYIGIRNIGEAEGKKSFVKNFNEFIKGSWLGLQTKILDSNNSDLEFLRENISNENLENVCALTGIPSIENGNKSLYPATIDRLISGMTKCKRWAYFVTADPIDTYDTENMLYQCRDINGKVESLKSFNISVGETSGTNESFTKTHTTGTSTSHSESETNTETNTIGESVSKKDFMSLAGITSIVGGGALTAAGLLFPPSLPLVLAGNFVTSLASSIVPTKTKSRSFSESKSHGVTDTETHSESDSDSHAVGTTESNSKTISQNVVNKHIEAIAEHLSQDSKRLMDGKANGLWKVGAYLLAEKSSDLKGAALQLRSILSGQNSVYESIRIHNITSLLDKTSEDGKSFRAISLGNFQSPKISVYASESEPFHHPLGTHYDELKSVLTTKELSYLVNFPLRSVPGIPVLECAEFGRTVSSYDVVEKSVPIRMGNIFNMHCEENMPVELDENHFSSHTFITGSTGSGKSNAIYHILNSLKKNGKHFLVVEPAKGEYKYVLGQNENDELHCDVHVYGTNPDLSLLLRINPFSFPHGNTDASKNIHILEHLDRLVEIFNVCWPMYAAMPAVLKEAIEKSYEDCGWNLVDSTNEYGENCYPNFTDIVRNIRDIIDRSDYDAENKGAYKGSLITRLKSLTNGINGLIFTDDEIDAKDLFDENVIVDLSRVGSVETKSLIMGLLVLKLQEYRMTSSCMNAPLKHVTVLEEAHNLLKHTSTNQSQDSGNLLGKSVEMLANSIAEMRTYGEGFIIADQAPALLDMSVIRNTNTKIILRLPDQGDRELVGLAANLNKDQITELAKLPCGVAAIYQNEWVEPVLCKISKFESVECYAKKDKKNYFDKVSYGKMKIRIATAAMTKQIYKKFDLTEDLKKINISSRSRTAVLEFLKSDRNAPDFYEMAPVMAELFSFTYSHMKLSFGACKNDYSTWIKNIVGFLKKDICSIEMDFQLRRDVIQSLIMQLIIFEKDDIELYSNIIDGLDADWGLNA